MPRVDGGGACSQPAKAGMADLPDNKGFLPMFHGPGRAACGWIDACSRFPETKAGQE